MTKFNHTGHKELWDWLAEHPNKEKFDWPEWLANGGCYTNPGAFCFACGYANKKGRVCCGNCPLVWPNDEKCSSDSASLYAQWGNEVYWEKRSELARQIRDLPVWEGVECE